MFGSSPAASRVLAVSRPNSGKTRTGGTGRSHQHHGRADPVAGRPAPHPAHVEDRIKELKTCGAHNLPSADWNRNSTWLQLAALAASLNAWLRHLALDGDLARAEPKALRYRLLGAPARHVTQARKGILKIPRLGLGHRHRQRLGASPSPAPRLNPGSPPPTSSHTPAGTWNPAPTRAHPRISACPVAPASPSNTPN